MHSAAARHNNDIARWLPAIGAVGVLGAVIIAGVAMGGGNDGGAASDPVAGIVDTASDSTLPVPSSVPDVTATVPTTAPIVKTTLARTLSEGMSGDDVRDVQVRLDELGFYLGDPDGVYGPLTRRAVWAYEKLVLGAPSDSPTGKVTAEMWDDLQEPFVIQPRRPNSTPTHVEIYLPEQVLAIFVDNVPAMILHTSTGSGDEWCEEVTISPGEYGNEEGDEPLVRGECGISKTPGGVFKVERKVEGRQESALGGMLNPTYFNYGIAIHGAYNVPLYPAPHGCIRVENDISDEVQGMLSRGDQVFVFDGVRDPEQYSDKEKLPVFNWTDEEWAATSSSTTTTTVPPSTTTTTTSSTLPQSTAVTTTSSTTTPTSSSTSSTTSSSTTSSSTTTTVAAEPDPDG